MKTKFCVMCGKEFLLNRGQIYCSDECRIEARKRKNRKWLTDDTGKVYEPQPKRCPFCGKEYTPKRSTQVCCLSPECSRAKDRARKSGVKRREPVTVYREFIDPENYARNQIIQTLASVPKIRVEL